MEGADFEPREKQSSTLIVWGLCIAVLLGPALLVWIVRGIGFAARCAPGPDLCHGIALGALAEASLSGSSSPATTAGTPAVASARRNSGT